ncbi:MAG: response regulator transcription factor [Acidobacteriota bacterium]
MKRRVLIIEDDPEIAALVSLHLEELDVTVDTVSDGLTGAHRAEEGNYDLVVLDLSLPGLDGLEICRRIRSGPPYIPILMLTARDSEVDRVLGLETGADDYLAKPFSVLELVARVKALFRRVDALRSAATGDSRSKVTAGDLTIDPETRQVSVRGETVTLTAKEFDLLLHFASNPGRVFTRAQLLDSVWGYGHEGYEHTVNSHINRLRGKIEIDPSKPNHILTVWGVGYRFLDDKPNETGS